MSSVIPFGKYKGQLLTHVLENDAGYLKWMLSLDNLKGKFKTDLFLLEEQIHKKASEQSNDKFRGAKKEERVIQKQATDALYAPTVTTDEKIPTGVIVVKADRNMVITDKEQNERRALWEQVKAQYRK